LHWFNQMRVHDELFPPPLGLRGRRLSFAQAEILVLCFPLENAALPTSLTAAERDVVERVLGGASNEEIAAARRSSRRTVANQLGSIFKKLGVASRAELASRLAGFGP
jgi:DNA-binding CsgD family transcriptional regulator